MRGGQVGRGFARLDLTSVVSAFGSAAAGTAAAAASAGLDSKVHDHSFHIDNLRYIVDRCIDYCQYIMEYCCTPVFEGVLDEGAADEMAPILGALADPARLRIVSMLAAAPDGAACGCDLETPLNLSQPTVSHHLKILREAGIIEGNRQGRWVYYRVVPERLKEIRDALSPVTVTV